jgi:hypothetical protein
LLFANILEPDTPARGLEAVLQLALLALTSSTFQALSEVDCQWNL